jgi:hypothetical protein
VGADDGSPLNDMWIGPRSIWVSCIIIVRAWAARGQEGGKWSVYSQVIRIITRLVRPKAEFKIDQSTRAPR